MAVASKAADQLLGEWYAGVVRDDPAAQELWVRRSNDRIDLWLLIEPMDFANDRRFYESAIGLLEAFPGKYFCLHVLNPAAFEPGTDLQEYVFPGAEQIPLRGPE